MALGVKFQAQSLVVTYASAHTPLAFRYLLRGMDSYLLILTFLSITAIFIALGEQGHKFFTCHVYGGLHRWIIIVSLPFRNTVQ